jgi:hypothetical protein
MSRGTGVRDVGGDQARRYSEVGFMASPPIVPLTNHNSRKTATLAKQLRKAVMLTATDRLKPYVKIGKCRYAIPKDVFLPTIQDLHTEFSSIVNPIDGVATGGWWQSRTIIRAVHYIGIIVGGAQARNAMNFNLILSEGSWRALKDNFAYRKDRGK